MTWLIYAPILQTLELRNCIKLRECLTGDETNRGTIFSSLTVLRLVKLPHLLRICPRVLPFPSLRNIEVVGCRNLEELPFDYNSAKKSLIHGDERWWNRLHWKDEAVKQVFSSKFVHHAW